VTKQIAAFRNFASALKTPPSDENVNLFFATGFFEMYTREETATGVLSRVRSCAMSHMPYVSEEAVLAIYENS
jgi:hypothetical protein